MQSVVNGVGNILDSLTFGGLGSWLGGNDKEVMETVNRLTESNEYLRESIDSLAERIGQGDNTNAESIDYYNDARKAELEWEENQRNIIKGLASAWTNSGYGFLGLGGKGSFNKHSPGSGWEGWDAFTETLRKNRLQHNGGQHGRPVEPDAGADGAAKGLESEGMAKAVQRRRPQEPEKVRWRNT